MPSLETRACPGCGEPTDAERWICPICDWEDAQCIPGMPDNKVGCPPGSWGAVFVLIGLPCLVVGLPLLVMAFDQLAIHGEDFVSGLAGATVLLSVPAISFYGWIMSLMERRTPSNPPPSGIRRPAQLR